MGIIKQHVNEAIDDTNKAIDYEIDETNRVGVSIAKDASGIGYGAIARALMEHDSENQERSDGFKDEVERREREEREAMLSKQKKSSFEQAVQETEGNLQVKADQKGLRSPVKERTEELER
jgi:hypothetical protein